MADLSRTLIRWLKDSLVPRLHRIPAVRAIGKRLFRDRVIKQPFHGGVICLDAVEHSWAWTGHVHLESWDRPIQDRLLDLSRRCETMIDVGANLGVMTLAVALRNPDIRIVCIEPNTRASQVLRQSLALNNLAERITVVEAVAGESDGEVAFDEGASATGYVSAAGPLRKRSVDFGRLAADAAAHGRCLVKIDVEGFETVLVKQLARVAARRNLIVLVELHASGFNGMGSPRECMRTLLESGATLQDLEGQAIEAIEDWTDRLATLQLEARWR